MPLGKSKEIIFHFLCEKCSKWWSVGDAPEEKNTWFCPWCGHANKYTKKEAVDEI